MSDKNKTIQEALAEVQRNAELKRIQEAKAIWGNSLQVDEGLSGIAGKIFGGGKAAAKGAKRAKPIEPMPHGGEKLTPETPKGKRGPEEINIKPDTSTGKTKIEPAKPAEAPKSGGLASKILGFGIGAGLGTVVGDRLAKQAKDSTNSEPSAAMSAPAEPEKPKDSPKSDDMTFGQAFAAARKAATEKGAKSTGQFSWHGKDYQTNIQGKGTPKAPEEKYVAPSKQTKVDIGTQASAPAAETPAAAPTPTPPKQSSGETYTNGREPGWRDTPPQPASPAPNAFQGSTKDTTPIGPDPTKFTKPESESGGKKKKMSEETNPLIAAFLKLQSENPSNMFEAAKKLSPEQKKKMDVDKDNDIDADDLSALRAGRKSKMEEDSLPTMAKPSANADTKSVTTDFSAPDGPAVSMDNKPVVSPTAPKVDTTIPSSDKKALDTKFKTIAREEVEFSQAEIDHINSFFLEASVAPNRPEVATGADSVSDKMSQNDVTGTSTESGGKKKVKEETDAADETNMAKTQLKAMSSKAMNLHSKLKTSKNLPAWVQSKLAVAKDGVTAVDDYMTHKEEVELEEGRPKKNPTPETTERDPRKHIQVEAGRAAAGNVIDFHHNDGTKSKLTPAMGRRIISHLNSLKPADRQTAVNKMHDSAEGLKV